MTATLPPDENARVRIATSLDETLFVDAGAGSGKTTALVGRVAALVGAGVGIDELAAITFTEAAAAELRHRLRRTLSTCVQRSAASGDAAGEARYRRALDGLDHAAIQTLHAFAQRLLRMFPIEAGLPPIIEVLDEISSVVEFDERWRAESARMHADPRYFPLLRRFIALGGKDAKLAGLARLVDDHWDRLVDVGPTPPDPPSSLAPVGPGAHQIGDRLRQAVVMGAHCADPTDKLLDLLNGEVRQLAELLSAPDVTDDVVLALLPEVASLKPARKGRVGNWGEHKAVVVELIEQAAGLANSTLSAARHEVLDALSATVMSFVVAGARARQRAGRLQFHDLIVLARDLVRDHPRVRTSLHHTFRVLLLDEFQDTDPLQLELAHAIASGPYDVPPSGRLFFVGDPKQSIYRFRRADLNVYLGARSTSGDGVCGLTANFRTVPGVIAWVNHVFGEVMVGEGQAPYEPLVAQRPEVPTGRPPVVMLGDPLDASASQVREQSAADLAGYLSELLATEFPVVDPSTGEMRPVRPDDICVLVPSRLAVPALESAFEQASIAYRLLTASLIWTAPEVRDVLAVLRAVDDAGDQLALVAALRTPLLGCTDADLADWKHRGGRWSAIGIDHDNPGPHPVAMALAFISTLQRDRWWLGVDGLVDRIISERAALELAVLAGRPNDRWRRLRYLADSAQAFAEGRRGDVRAFLAWTELQQSDVVRVSTPVLPDPHDPAVQVMTMHGSKGLEFPVVALFGLGTAPRNAARTVLFAGDRSEVRLGSGMVSAGFDDIAAAEEQMEDQERIRLLYVAATRARDHLVVCAHHKASKSKPSRSFGALVFQHHPTDQPEVFAHRPTAFAGAPLGGGSNGEPNSDASDSPNTAPNGGSTAGSASRPAGLPHDLVHALPDPSDPQVQTALNALAQDRSARDELAAGSTDQVWSATAVARVGHDRLHAPESSGGAAPANNHPTDGDPDDSPDQEPGWDSSEDTALDGGDDPGTGAAPVRWRRGRAGTAIGRAVHGTLQLVDFADPTALESIARVQAVAEGVESHLDTVIRLARSAVASPDLAELVAREHWREMYVAAPIGSVVVEGYVDLLADDGNGGLVVLDYKTDTVRSDDDVRERLDRYRLQAATYALAVTAVTGRPVTRAVFLFLGASGAIAAEVSDLDHACAEAHSILSEAPSTAR